MAKKILVWDGIFKGYRYVSEEEMRDRKALHKKMIMDFLKWFAIAIILLIIFFWILIKF